MPYTFIPGKMYRMPSHFGPSAGPRAGKDGRKFENKDNPKTTSISVSFLTNAEQLEALLPERFELFGDPIVTVYANYMKDIEWLAGRGYNVLGISFPAMFRGERDQAQGSFLSVLWENLTDPIITGREELGFSKIYCELPDPFTFEGETRLYASWMGFRFLDVRVGDMRKLSVSDIKVEETRRRQQAGDGVLHYKYIPRTGQWGMSDVEYACLTPATALNRVVKAQWTGRGTVQFHKARWEDMPTQYNIVNVFHTLDIKEPRGASITKTIGAKDLGDQRILH